MLFEEACYLYIADKSEGRKPVRPNTLEGYLSAIRCHLMPKWCGVEIERITADDLQAWVDSFDKPGSAAKALGFTDILPAGSPACTNFSFAKAVRAM